ncbi:hypothetical protein VNO80_07062 [Phaseolus coccineus]|uniref:Uncharacterized protein n=1 Tax=Phaseolus coccineus TaxID=3886 RepID=A0AAN9NIW9_PHACN
MAATFREATVMRSRVARVRRSRAAHGGTCYHVTSNDGSTCRDDPRAGLGEGLGAGLGTRLGTGLDVGLGDGDEVRQRALSTTASGDVDRCGGSRTAT